MGRFRLITATGYAVLTMVPIGSIGTWRSEEEPR